MNAAITLVITTLTAAILLVALNVTAWKDTLEMVLNVQVFISYSVFMYTNLVVYICFDIVLYTKYLLDCINHKIELEGMTNLHSPIHLDHLGNKLNEM